LELYDISRAFFQSPGYPGDPLPHTEPLCRMETGDDCNLTLLSAGVHTATHVDAPRHYLLDGATVDALPLEPFFGPCTVVSVEGIVTGADVDDLMRFARERVLFHGDGKAFLSQSAAFALADAGVLLVGTDAVSIARYGDEAAPHKELLMHGIPILEGLDLSAVPDGEYTLSAFPVCLDGLEGAPVRAVLIGR
jgi:arylformamidase